jgi:hypothetical protein
MWMRRQGQSLDFVFGTLSLANMISCMTRWVAWMQSSFGALFVGFGFGFNGLLMGLQ